MLASELITDLIPPLKTSDTVQKALNWMADFRVTHLPIVNQSQLLGVISEEDIIELNEPNQPIGNQELSNQICYVNESQHIYDVIRMVSEQHLSIVPVLDAKQNYLGLVSIHDLVHHVANIGALSNPGAIIVLEMGVRDYSLAEVSRIVESNNASILSSYISSQPDSARMELTLKLSTTNINPILADFERFKYTLRGSFHHQDTHDIARDNFDSLMKYLDI